MKKVDNCAVNFKFMEYVDDVRTDLEVMISGFSCTTFGISETKKFIEREYNNCMDSIKSRVSELINITCFLSGAEVISIDDCCRNCSFIHSMSEELYRWVGKIYVDKLRDMNEN